jgi:hypothetical protein
MKAKDMQLSKYYRSIDDSEGVNIVFKVVGMQLDGGDIYDGDILINFHLLENNSTEYTAPIVEENSFENLEDRVEVKRLKSYGDNIFIFGLRFLIDEEVTKITGDELVRYHQMWKVKYLL